MGVREFISEHTSLDVTRPANSLKNWFIGIPIGVGLLFGVVIEGNPLSKFVSSLGVGGRRAIGSAITETTPQVQEGAQLLYGNPTQSAQGQPRNNGIPMGNCQNINGWTYCPTNRN